MTPNLDQKMLQASEPSVLEPALFSHILALGRSPQLRPLFFLLFLLPHPTSFPCVLPLLAPTQALRPPTTAPSKPSVTSPPPSYHRPSREDGATPCLVYPMKSRLRVGRDLG